MTTHVKTKRKLKAAIVGLGNIGFGFNYDKKRKGVWTHATAYSKSGVADIVAGVDTVPKMRNRFNSHYPGASAYADIVSMLNAESPDVVSICTPVDTHYKLVKECANLGVKAIFCEKPVAGNIKDAKAIYDICKKNKIKLAVNHTRRWDWRYRRVAEAVQSGFVGDVKYVVALYSGHLFNMGTHLLDTVRMITGKRYEKVSAFNVYAKRAKEDPHVSGILKMDGGTLCHISCHGLREDLIFEIDVVGSNGRIKITENGEKTEFLKFKESSRYGGYRELKKEKSPPISSKEDRFVAAVRNLCTAASDSKSPLLCSGEDGYYAVASAIAMKKSASQSGRYIAIPKI